MDVPTIRPHVLSVATMNSQTIVLVRILCSDGIEGIGEAATIGGLSYGDESPEGIKLAIDAYVEPVLRTADAACVAGAMMGIQRAVVGNHFAKSAIETALLDAHGKRLGLPIDTFLGGRIRGRLPVAWTLASGNTAIDIDEAEKMLSARRHNIFKLKIGKRALAEDIAHVAAIKLALGDRASVRVDVNQAWSEEVARRGIAMLADAGVDLVEQPISRANAKGMARLSSISRIAVMADESLRGPSDAFDLAARHASDVFAIKLEQSGGLFAAQRVAAIADAAGLGVYGGTMLEGGIGTVASAHLFSTLPRLDWGTELFGPLLLTEEILAEPLDYSEFSLGVPTGPGLGILLDEEKVAFLSRDHTTSLHTIPVAEGA